MVRGLAIMAHSIVRRTSYSRCGGCGVRRRGACAAGVLCAFIRAVRPPLDHRSVATGGAANVPCPAQKASAVMTGHAQREPGAAKAWSGGVAPGRGGGPQACRAKRLGHHILLLGGRVCVPGAVWSSQRAYPIGGQLCCLLRHPGWLSDAVGCVWAICRALVRGVLGRRARARQRHRRHDIVSRVR